MIPLVLSGMGETLTVKRVEGNPGTKKFLESIGFVEGATVMVVAKACGSLIVSVKDSRIAIDREIANRIMV